MCPIWGCFHYFQDLRCLICGRFHYFQAPRCPIWRVSSNVARISTFKSGQIQMILWILQGPCECSRETFNTLCLPCGWSLGETPVVQTSRSPRTPPLHREMLLQGTGSTQQSRAQGTQQPLAQGRHKVFGNTAWGKCFFCKQLYP